MRTLIITLAIVAILALALAAVLGPTDPLGLKGEQKSQKTIACEAAALNELVAPSSAIFIPDATKERPATSRENEEYGIDFVITGKLDAQNSFGAMIRMEYRCGVTEVGNNYYAIIDDIGATIDPYPFRPISQL